jgi:hypothetical protein
MIFNATTLAHHDLPPGDPPPLPDPIDLRPASAYEAVTRQMVESLAEDLREIKSRLNSLIFMMVGAILLDVLSRAFAS